MRKPSISCLAAIVVGVISSDLQAENWPQFRGPRRDGTSSETGLLREWPEGGPKVLWTVPLGPGYAAPAVYDGKVYVNDYDDGTKEWLVRCLSLEDGTEAWRFSEKKRIRPNHLITRTVPAVDGTHVFSLDPKCIFHCLDAATGKELWSKNFVREFKTRIPPWYAGQCPLVEEDRVLVAPGGEALVVALEKPSGKEIWRTPNEEKWLMSHVSLMPAELCGVRQYLYATLEGVQGISAADGRLLWFFPAKFNLAAAVSPLAVGGDRVFMTNLYQADSFMLRVTRDGEKFSASEVFRFSESKWNSEVHTPILFEDHMFAVGKKRRGLFTCLDLDGEIVWTSDGKASFELGSFLLADGLFFIVEGKTGMLRLLEASTTGYKELGSAQILEGHDVWGPMALSNGKLLARDTTKLVCLQVGKKAVASAKP